MSEKRGKGQPTKINQIGRRGVLVSESILASIREGAYIETAAAAEGIERQTIFNWLKWGRENKSKLYRDFFDAVTQARAEDAIRDISLVTKAASSKVGDLEWRAAAWKLERKNPRHWSPKVTATVASEMSAAVGRLSKAFGEEPLVLEKILTALSGEDENDFETDDT